MDCACSCVHSWSFVLMDEAFEDMANTAENYYQEQQNKPQYPESWQAAYDDYELSEDVI